jgi:hypothetical protein
LKVAATDEVLVVLAVALDALCRADEMPSGSELASEWEAKMN